VFFTEFSPQGCQSRSIQTTAVFIGCQLAEEYGAYPTDKHTGFLAANIKGLSFVQSITETVFLTRLTWHVVLSENP